MERFGRYDLTSPLARGGMAELFFANDNETGARVVVKRLRPELERRQEILDLFLTEADVGSMLQHDNIVRVLDAGEFHGRYYLAMEFVDGMDLRHLLGAASPLPLQVALRVAIDVLRGLDFAHRLKGPQGNTLGLVHRDVSPDNVFIDRRGVAKVGDFGIAKLVSLEGPTQTGLLKGKLAYMSPEQVAGLALDPRADGYALGLVLFEMLTSSQPFSARPGEGEVAQLLRVRSGRVRGIRRVEPSVPRAVARPVDKMLRAWRPFRFPTCGAFADALEDAAEKLALDTDRRGVAELLNGQLAAKQARLPP